MIKIGNSKAARTFTYDGKKSPFFYLDFITLEKMKVWLILGWLFAHQSKN
jgi:hypothetical protein